MNELPRINTLAPLVYTPDNTVPPVSPVVDKNISIGRDDRRRTNDRRKHKQKPLIERRVSSNRRSPLFDEQV